MSHLIISSSIMGGSTWAASLPYLWAYLWKDSPTLLFCPLKDYVVRSYLSIKLIIL